MEKDPKPPSFLDLSSSHREQLSTEMSEGLVRMLCLPELEMTDAVFARMASVIPDSRALQILWGRIHTHHLRVDHRVVILCHDLSSSPGDLVMWAWTFRCMGAHERVISLPELVHEFSTGFPSEAGRNAIWDRQKDSRGANLLDMPSTWEPHRE
jgi:hypothetical protein